jgi:hypothetical protein
MTPNSTNARRKLEIFASRAAGNGARIRNHRAVSSRNEVSLLIVLHKNGISRAGVGNHFRKSFRCRLEFVPRGSGAPRRGHQSAPDSGQAGFSVQQKNYREPLIASALGGNELTSFRETHATEAYLLIPPTVLAIGGSRSCFCSTQVVPWPDPGPRWCPRRGAPIGVAREVAVVWTKLRSET